MSKQTQDETLKTAVFSILMNFLRNLFLIIFCWQAQYQSNLSSYLGTVTGVIATVIHTNIQLRHKNVRNLNDILFFKYKFVH